MRRLAQITLTRSRLVIVGFTLVTLVLGIGLTRIVFDDSIESMYPDGAPLTVLQHQLEQTFGAGKLLVAVVEGDIYTPQRLTDLARLTTALQGIPGVERVTSVANATRMADDDGLLRIDQVVDPQHLSAADIAGIRDFLASSSLYGHGRLVNEQGTAASVLMQISTSGNPHAIVRAVRTTLASDWHGQAHLAGSPLFEVEMRNIARRDLPLLVGLAALLIVLVLYLNFRTVRGALLPLLAVGIGAVWAVGAMGWLGTPLTILNVIGLVAILAVGSSFSLHLLGRYVYELSLGRARDDAIRLAVSETGLGVLISGVAISAAMTTLVLSSIPTVRAMGLLTAGGVLSALVASLLLFPAILRHLPAPRRLPAHEGPSALSGPLRGLARFVARRRHPILIAAAVLAAVGGIGASRIVPDTAVLAYFRKDSALRQNFDLVAHVFGGTSQVEVQVKGDLTDPQLLRAMLAFERGVDSIPGVGTSTSIADVIQTIHEALTGSSGLPATPQAVAQELLVYQMSGNVSDITQLMTLDHRQGLIQITTSASSTERVQQILHGIEGVAATTIGQRAELGYTGPMLLQLAIQDALLHDFIVSLTLAIGLVVIIDSLVRSMRAALVTILALLVTIVLQYGVLGYLGLPLDLATMLLGTLAIGVGDYAIHLTVRYMEERRRGQSPEAAMEQSLMTSGRSIVFTALTLGAGFAAMITSNFVPIRTLGMLMDFTVVSIGVMSLTVLPAACLVFLRDPRPPKARKGKVPTYD